MKRAMRNSCARHLFLEQDICAFTPAENHCFLQKLIDRSIQEMHDLEARRYKQCRCSARARFQYFPYRMELFLSRRLSSTLDRLLSTPV